MGNCQHSKARWQSLLSELLTRSQGERTSLARMHPSHLSSKLKTSPFVECLRFGLPPPPPGRKAVTMKTRDRFSSSHYTFSSHNSDNENTLSGTGLFCEASFLVV